jgi:hypothetical protein
VYVRTGYFIQLLYLFHTTNVLSLAKAATISRVICFWLGTVIRVMWRARSNYTTVNASVFLDKVMIFIPQSSDLCILDAHNNCHSTVWKLHIQSLSTRIQKKTFSDFTCSVPFVNEKQLTGRAVPSCCTGIIPWWSCPGIQSLQQLISFSVLHLYG